MLEVAAGSLTVLVCRLGETVVAVSGQCPHRGAPMIEGELDCAILRCPWHGASFDVRTGDRVRGPACGGLRRYGAEIVRGDVVIDVDEQRAR
jgi:3-phenylpropionate/trans-cinnamate dioxygenase ferredoxin reductase subunit